MKAVVYTKYGSPDVLHLTERPKPTLKDDEVLIRIRATSVNFGDSLARRFNEITPRTFSMPAPLWLPTRLFFGWRKPKRHILGAELAGDIEAIGNSVTQFKVGDAVFAYRGPSFGGNAEYIAVKENSLVALKPENMTYEEAATIPYGAITALNLLRQAHIQAGQRVLINGASGGIGSYALQLAKHYGAEVTGVCGTLRMDFVKSLGADHVIDYSKEDFTQSGQKYDLIMDILGKSSFARVKNSLTTNGRYMLASFKMNHLFQMLWTSRMSSKKVVCALSGEKQADLVAVKELVESGAIKTAVDRCFPLEETAEAHRYYESGQRRGNVVVTV